MAFGLSFGAKKQSSKSTTDVNKTTDTTQAETGSKATSGVSTTTGSTTSTGNQTGQTTNTGATTGSQTNQQNSTLFSSGILSGLEGIVQGLFGSAATKPMALNSNFDKSEFVADTDAAAAARTDTDLNTGLNGVFDEIGGRDDQNSMSTLLANRARGDAAAQLAGVHANAVGQAEGIARDNFSADLAGQGQSQGFLEQLLGALKGGTANTTGGIQTAENTSQAGTSAQQTAEQQNTQQTTTQQLLELLANAMAGSEHTVGTESTKTNGTEFGGGLSLGF